MSSNHEDNDIRVLHVLYCLSAVLGLCFVVL